MDYHLAIVGGGLTGAAMLFQFVKKLKTVKQSGARNFPEMRIAVIEKGDEFGPGHPYSDTIAKPYHLTNMAIDAMTIAIDDPEDLYRWIDENRRELRAWFSEKMEREGKRSEADLFSDLSRNCPRIVVGKYLKERFAETISEARKEGVSVDLFPAHEVLDAADLGERVRIDLKNLDTRSPRSIHADRMVLATGHWSSRPGFDFEGSSNYFSSPWPADELLKNIHGDRRAAILGTSLSAIDAALTLASAGEFVRCDDGSLDYIPPENPIHILLCSRRGLLPKPHGKRSDYRNRFLTPENMDRLIARGKGNISLQESFQLLDSELRSIYGHSIEWKTVMNPEGGPSDILEHDLSMAKNGDLPDGSVGWCTVLRQAFVDDLFTVFWKFYGSLSPENKVRMGAEFASLLRIYGGPTPILNMERLWALMKSGVLEVVTLGREYTISRYEQTGDFEIAYTDPNGQTRRDSCQYLINCTGLGHKYAENPSPLARSLIRSGQVLLESEPLPENPNAPRNGVDLGAGGSRNASPATYESGGVKVDPDTLQIINRDANGNETRSGAMFAVGLMIGFPFWSARISAHLTKRVADVLIDQLNS